MTPEDLLTSRAIDIAKIGASEEERKRWDAWREATENVQTIVSARAETPTGSLDSMNKVFDSFTSCFNVVVISSTLIATYISDYLKGRK